LNIQDLTARRHLDWPACYNARDLGGLPAGNGQETQWRSIIRSDYLNRLTDAGRQAALDYGVRTVIDLRGAQEVAREPAIPVQDGDRPLDYRHLPLDRFEPAVGALISQARSRGEVYCIILDHYGDAVADIMRAIVDAPPGGIVVHCQAGKDRTGIIAALLLRLVGVPAELIAADYAESQARLWPIDEKQYAEMRAQGDTSFWWQPTVTEAEMHTMLGHVEAHYGDVEQYLQGAGLSPADLAQLRSRLVAP